MKNMFIATVAWLVCCQLQAEEGFKPLFNGMDLSGWHSMAEKRKEGAGVFFVDAAEKAIRPYAGKVAGSKQPIDCLHSEKEYSHFILKLEYKWLESRFAPRLTHDRDAGLLFHLHGDLKKIWPNSVEMQIGESNAKKIKDRYTTGDLWVIGKDLQVMNARDSRFYAPGAKEVPVGKDLGYDKSYVTTQNEKPYGEWNEITLTVRGSEEATFELNGKVVNRIGKMSYEVDGKRVPLSKGHIGLQAEYAELLYRNIRIKELSGDEAS
ncbi:3-keto-disaccharide hydrolase [Haloferula sp.]|uniref:3-keto-disaccharide hydrolase n=1 Tax=Haloferula sp. TaxID=2497595 RepID=UPI003C707539